MKRFLRHALLWGARLLGILILLLIIFYAEEDWRGARDWAACQRDLAAQGETLDLRQLAPPGKPEDDLSKVPIFAELYQENDEYQKTGKSTIKPKIRNIKIELDPSPAHGSPPDLSNYRNEKYTDLTAWQKYYRSIPESHLPNQVGTPAQDVLQTLSQFDPELNEMDAAVSKPNAYWPKNKPTTTARYVGGMVTIVPVVRVLQLRSVAHLDNHETELAEKDYLFAFHLIQPLIKESDLLNYEIVAAAVSKTDAILWEGLHRHAWTEAQLNEMEACFASIDMLGLATASYRIERDWMLEGATVYQNYNFDVVGTAEDNDIYYNLGLYHLPISRIRPKGWWDEDRSAYCYGMQGHINAIDMKKGTIFAAQFPFRDMSNSWASNRAETSLWSAIYIPITALVMPFTDDTGLTIARAETYRRLARLACRLEEYRLAHGQYPDALDALPDLPPHLNQEVLSEQPLRYQRKGGGYLLYSLGWSQRDEGGVYSTDAKEGNWPWPSP